MWQQCFPFPSDSEADILAECILMLGTLPLTNGTVQVKCMISCNSLQIQLQLVLLSTNTSNTEIYDFIGSETNDIL